MVFLCSINFYSIDSLVLVLFWFDLILLFLSVFFLYSCIKRFAFFPMLFFLGGKQNHLFRDFDLFFTAVIIYCCCCCCHNSTFFILKILKNKNSKLFSLSFFLSLTSKHKQLFVSWFVSKIVKRKSFRSVAHSALNIGWKMRYRRWWLIFFIFFWFSI